MTEVASQEDHVDVKRYGVGHGDVRLDSVHALLVRSNALLVGNPAEALGDAPDVGIDSKDIRIESELEEAAGDLGADTGQGQQEGFRLLRGHAFQRTQGHPSEGCLDSAPGFPDVGCAAVGEPRAFQGRGKCLNRCFENGVMRGEEKLAGLKGFFTRLHGGARAEHKPEQLIQQIRIFFCGIFPIMVQEQCIDFFRLSPLLFHVQDRSL